MVKIINVSFSQTMTKTPNPMQLIPEFLPVGSVVDRIQDNENVNPIVITANDVDNCQKFNKLFNELHRPIPLTEKILTEWCGAYKLKGFDEFGIVFENDGVLLEFGEMLNDGRAVFYYNLPDTISFKCIANIHYLHELQLLCAGLKLPLPIQIK